MIDVQLAIGALVAMGFAAQSQARSWAWGNRVSLAPFEADSVD